MLKITPNYLLCNEQLHLKLIIGMAHRPPSKPPQSLTMLEIATYINMLQFFTNYHQLKMEILKLTMKTV